MPLWVPNMQVGISTDGNTGGTTGFENVQMELVGTNLITLSQSTGAGGNTVTIVGPRIPSIVRYDNLPVQGTVSNQTNSPYVALGTVNGSMHLFPMSPANDVFPANMSASTLYLDMSGNVTGTPNAVTLRYSIGVYTLAGASTLSLLNSATGSITAASGSGQTSLWSGARYLTLANSQFSQSLLTFSQTSYWMGIIFSSSSTALPLSLFGAYQGDQGIARSGTMGVSGATNNSRDWAPWSGVVGTAALPASIHISGVTKTGASGGFVPHVLMENLHSAW